jgi:metallo-beta-lactamase family protein
LESTFGGVERAATTPELRRRALIDEVKAAHANGGPLVIPAFAVERTQELLADLISIMEEVEAPPGPIFLDSPLAIKATNVFLSEAYDAMGRNPFSKLRESRLLRFTESVNESREIERVQGWHVIIAASGMCDAGRIRHHLKRLLWRDETTLMLVGFQPVGTLGRLLLEGRTEVRIQGEPIKVRARVRMLDAYSGHADGPGLTRWASARRPVSGITYLVHGEQANISALRTRLVEAGFDAEGVIPAKLDESYTLTRAAFEREAVVPRIEADSVSRLDWHNARAEFLSKLSAAAEAAPDNASRKDMFERLAAVLDEAEKPEIDN